MTDLRQKQFSPSDKADKLNATLALQMLKIHSVFFSVFAAFSTRLFSVLRFESVIHEFDP